MPTVYLTTVIKAPIEQVFDAARSIDIHQQSMSHTNEQAIAGRTTGKIELGESVTWEAIHFGIKQNLTAKITEMKSPHTFTDEMVHGAFKHFKHTHTFTFIDNFTIMKDTFTYTSPLGPIGKLADILFLKRYMTKLLTKRNDALKLHLEKT
ncbi:MAG: cell division protein [Bacteroidetes bacterium]|nr:MAG: cell division protein [Bacteroidota bacterium]